jgi:hypothetical protein
MDGCNIIACFNYAQYKNGIYCFKHKEKDMVDVKNVSNICKSEMCNTRVSNEKYKGYCLRCFVYLFPNEPNSRNYKTKEKIIVDYINETFKDYKIINDKIIGSSKRRPDILIQLSAHIIIVEIDENQHQRYENICENKRLMEISQDLAHPNIIFIRFNPDDYIDKDNKKISSCWKINKEGVCVLKNNKINEWNVRLTLLKDRIYYWINNVSNKHITIEKLYFNDDI